MDNVLPNDPLFSQQWHLNNTGQSGGTPGEDINVLPAWDIATGDGVVIGFVDGAIDLSHPDLNNNQNSLDFEGGYDFVEDKEISSRLLQRGVGFGAILATALNAGLDVENLEGFRFLDLPTDVHGTAVAGIAVASSNDQGITGVAYNASFSPLRIQFDEEIAPDNLDAQIAGALSYKNQDIDIYNSSWRIPFPILPLGESTAQALETAITDGRDGLGNIFVFAAGNNAEEGGNANYYPLTNSRYTITVGALDHNGVRPSYSNPGASLLISTYGGDDEGILTTDIQGENDFDTSDYTEFFRTSAATPIVSGVIALMLEVNPDLTWRDVQHILVETAVKNDPNNPDWAENGAGYSVNHNYGFGSIDATAAVTLAQNWQTVEPEFSISSDVINIDASVPDNNPDGITSSINIEEDLTIESIEIVTDADLVQEDLEVVLTSPDGTQSILSANDLNSNQEGTWAFTSLRHWGESSTGEWNLRVVDSEKSSSKTLWDSWQLNFYGTNNEIVPNSSNDNSINWGALSLELEELIDRLVPNSSNENSINAAELISENPEFQIGNAPSLLDGRPTGSFIDFFIQRYSNTGEDNLNSEDAPLLPRAPITAMLPKTDGKTIFVEDDFFFIPDFETNPFFANTVAPDAPIIKIEEVEQLDKEQLDSLAGLVLNLQVSALQEEEDLAIQLDGDLLYITGEGNNTVSTDLDDIGLPDLDDIGLPEFFTPPADTSFVPILTAEQGEAVYRLFNKELNLQFYTTSVSERDTVLQDLPQYESQGISFIAAPEPEGNDITGISPVYRLFNSNTGVHLYTISEAEKDSVVENLPNYNLEGIEYYGYETQVGETIPLYRFYNPSLDAHFYTPSTDERDEYIASSDFQIEGNNEGIAFYVQPAP